MHILVVEDEKRLAALLRRVLMEERHVVDLAHDGASGLGMVLGGSYDLVILDLMLPEMDGMTVCREMRKAKIEAPVLMLTARGAIEDRVEGLKTGADDYLVKPFAMEELLARVDALLRRRNRQLDASSQLRVADLSLDLLRHEANRGGHLDRAYRQGVCPTRISHATPWSGPDTDPDPRPCVGLRPGHSVECRRHLHSLPTR